MYSLLYTVADNIEYQFGDVETDLLCEYPYIESAEKKSCLSTEKDILFLKELYTYLNINDFSFKMPEEQIEKIRKEIINNRKERIKIILRRPNLSYSDFMTISHIAHNRYGIKFKYMNKKIVSIEDFILLYARQQKYYILDTYRYKFN